MVSITAAAALLAASVVTNAAPLLESRQDAPLTYTINSADLSTSDPNVNSLSKSVGPVLLAPPVSTASGPIQLRGSFGLTLNGSDATSHSCATSGNPPDSATAGTFLSCSSGDIQAQLVVPSDSSSPSLIFGPSSGAGPLAKVTLNFAGTEQTSGPGGRGGAPINRFDLPANSVVTPDPSVAFV